MSPFFSIPCSANLLRQLPLQTTRCLVNTYVQCPISSVCVCLLCLSLSTGGFTAVCYSTNFLRIWKCDLAQCSGMKKLTNWLWAAHLQLCLPISSEKTQQKTAIYEEQICISQFVQTFCLFTEGVNMNLISPYE